MQAIIRLHWVYLFKRSRALKQSLSYFIVWLICFFVSTGVLGFSGNNLMQSLSSSISLPSPTTKAIELVKGGHFVDHDNKTVGEAVDGFFSNPRWESFAGMGDDSTEKMVVNVQGGMTYMEKPVDATLQFTVDMASGAFKVNAFELNGIPQNGFMISGLINKMFE